MAHCKLIIIWLVFNQFITLVITGGIVEINLLSYKNEQSKDDHGYCCMASDQMTTGPCDNPCAVFFRICLKEFQTVIISDDSNCPFGNMTTQLIAPGYSMTKLSQPLQFPFSFSWRGDFSMIIEVYHSLNETSHDYDKNKQLLMKVAEGKKLSAAFNWTTEWHRNECSQLQVEYRMVCDRGYYGSDCSRHCSPRDDQFAHFVCSKNGYKICIPGWTGVNCDKAVCRAGCHEDHGSCAMPDECKCRMGYDGPLCDSCLKYPGCVHGTCEKAFQCICDEGWGGIFCNQDLNYCTNSKPCKNNATCTNTGPGLYTCMCKAGFAGTNCELLVESCASDSCYNGGTCIDGATNFTCSCTKGFTGRQCRSSVKSCFENPCENGATCFDSVRGYLCSCPAGWEGHNCDIKSDACKTNPCQNNGRCISDKNGLACKCMLGYDGSMCEHNIDNCASQPCLNGGSCIDKVNNFQCLCPAGFTDTLCQTEINVCIKKPCKNGASCHLSSVNSYKCLCPAGFAGSDCSMVGGDCLHDSCKFGGTCISSGIGHICLCSPCFFGLDCSILAGNCNISSNWNNSAEQPLLGHSNLILILCLIILLVIFIIILSVVVITVRRRLYSRKDGPSWRDREANHENESNDKRSKQMYDYKDNRLAIKVENDIYKLEKIKNYSEQSITKVSFKNPNLLESKFIEKSKLNMKSNLALHNAKSCKSENLRTINYANKSTNAYYSNNRSDQSIIDHSDQTASLTNKDKIQFFPSNIGNQDVG